MEIIGNIMDLTHDIYLIYLELFRLEVRGNRGNERYLSLIKSLEEKVNEEKEIYGLLYQDRDSFNILFNYVKNKPTQLMYLRMYSYMIFNMMDCNLENIEIEDKFRRFFSACNKDVFLVYLSFLQDYIDAENCVSMREGLIYSKYYSSFINPDLEEYLVVHKFKIFKNNYAQAHFVSKVLLMDENIAKNEIIDFYYDAVVVSMISLLNVLDEDYDDKDKMVDIVSSQCMFRASLSMFSEQEYNSLRDGLCKILKEYTNNQNKKSVSIVNSITDSRVKDKSRSRRIPVRH